MTRLGSFFLGVVFLCFGFVLPVSGEPINFKPFFSLDQEYNDNILFSKNFEEEDFITTLSGGLVIEQRSERVNANLSARLDQLLYWHSDELNSLDMFFKGDVDYKATERLGLGGSAEYSEDSRPDRDTATTGLLVNGDRTTKRASLSSNYLFSELTRGEVAVGFGNIETTRTYKDESNDALKIDLSFSRNLFRSFKNTTGLLNFNYLHYTSDINTTKTPSTEYRDNTSDVFQFSGGFSKDITELYNIYCQAGASYTETTESRKIGGVTIQDEDSSGWGGVLSAGLNYGGEYYDANLALSQDMKGAVGTNGVVQRSMISGSVKKRITDRVSLTLNANVFLNKNDRKIGDDMEELTFNIQPGFRYKIFNDLILTASYRFTSIQDRIKNTNRERNMVNLVIRKEFEL